MSFSSSASKGPCFLEVAHRVVDFVKQLILPFWQSFEATAKMAERAESPRIDFQCALDERNRNPNENHHDLIISDLNSAVSLPAFRFPRSAFPSILPERKCADQTKVRRSGKEEKNSWEGEYGVRNSERGVTPQRHAVTTSISRDLVRAARRGTTRYAAGERRDDC
jgi:hypothetical protein